MAVPGVARITPPSPSTLLTPILPALTAAAASTEPATGVLPHLAPILRQRVRFLSATSSDPWLRLLCYDSAKAVSLAAIASSGALEPHPVSGEVEVDWDYDSQTRYRRLDSETLQALVVLAELGLAFQLVWCVQDPDGEPDGWRIGEVTIAEKPEPFSIFGGAQAIEEAERQFEEKKNAQKQQHSKTNGFSSNGHLSANAAAVHEEEDDDDAYWAQYDATPGRTPAQKHSPAPHPNGGVSVNTRTAATEEDNYFAQYDSVQPAMDNHDPDEQATAEQLAPPPLGLGADRPQTNGSQPSRVMAEVEPAEHQIHHPRPESSASSNGSQMVAKLEEEAGRRGQSEFGVKQHISRSVRSLFMLSRASGIERDEFERLVKTELDVLGMMDHED